MVVNLVLAQWGSKKIRQGRSLLLLVLLLHEVWATLFNSNLRWSVRPSPARQDALLLVHSTCTSTGLFDSVGGTALHYLMCQCVCASTLRERAT